MNDSDGDVEQIIVECAQRLKDPQYVAATATMPGNIDTTPGVVPSPPWLAGSLALGHAGIAVLLAELSKVDSSYFEAATRHLTQAVNGFRSSSLGVGLLSGIAGIGFAASAVARTPDDCRNIRTVCDELVVSGAMTAMERGRWSNGLRTFSAYDVISGLTGTARYLLRALGPEDRHVVNITRFIAELARLRPWRGRALPGWLVEGQPSVPADPRYVDGHLNLGVAHGIAGPLAYLAIARQAGVRAEGLDDAMHRMAEWIISWYGRGYGNTAWPSFVSPNEETAKNTRAASGDRGAWCYGTPGIARSLFLAGQALDVADWTNVSHAAMRTAVQHFTHHGDLRDVGFCHGWAGLLRIADLTTSQGETVDYSSFAELCKARIIAQFCPDDEFGFRYDTFNARLPRRNPNLLSGATGTLLALIAHLRGGTSKTGWEQAFLLI